MLKVLFQNIVNLENQKWKQTHSSLDSSARVFIKILFELFKYEPDLVVVVYTLLTFLFTY